MISLKRFSCILFILIFSSFVLRAQMNEIVVLHDRVLENYDCNVSIIGNEFKNYVVASVKDFFLRTDSANVKYWNTQRSNIDRYGDIVGGLGLKNIYVCGKTMVHDILLRPDSTYILHATTFVPVDSASIDVLSHYKICATIMQGSVKFHNYATYSIENNIVGYYYRENINYYFPLYYSIDKRAVKKTDAFISKIQQEYGFNDGLQPIMYFLGNNLDDAYSIVGAGYSVATTSQPTAGMYAGNNIIYSQRPDHLHELAHALFMPRFPQAHRIFHEGLADYLTLSPDLHEKRKNQFRDYIRSAQLSITTDEELYQLDRVNADGSNHFYTLGVMLIEHAHRQGGAAKVIALLRHKSALTAIASELGIDDIMSFARNN